MYVGFSKRIAGIRFGFGKKMTGANAIIFGFFAVIAYIAQVYLWLMWYMLIWVFKFYGWLFKMIYRGILYLYNRIKILIEAKKHS